MPVPGDGLLIKIGPIDLEQGLVTITSVSDNLSSNGLYRVLTVRPLVEGTLVTTVKPSEPARRALD